ncbi:MAG: hypothetical protein MUC41_05400 [Syntrophobacteraceae bacterium]|jgi:hypothetical protein|nr:hypothetical protein [Syntrophobacteraceae bacterium]
MDKQFLEFWGSSLLAAAKSQKQLEEMAAWARQGFKGFEEMTALFLKSYGLSNCAEGSPDCITAWKKAEEDFKQSFKAYMGLFGLVPKSEHLQLVKKYEELKEKFAAQEETIKHLRMLLSESTLKDQGELARQFDDLIRQQNDQFQHLMDNFSKAFKKGSSGKDAKPAGG